MLRRLLLMLLMACLAAPALAMPGHCEPQPKETVEAVHEGHQAAPDDETGKAHKAVQHGARDCIGCIAPYHALTAPDAHAAPVGIIGNRVPASLQTGPAFQPDPPPPRT